MGNGESFFKRLRERFFGKDVRILMCGLDAAGKTSILFKLKLGEVITTMPTIGINVETFKYKGINFTTWDISGRDKIRPLWRHYCQNTDVLIFIIDSNDRERMPECHDELWRFFGEEELKNSLVLVLANKQDLPNAMSVEEITEQLKLNSMKDRAWHIEGTCATSGDGLYEGLTWLQTELTGKQIKRQSQSPFKRLVTL